MESKPENPASEPTIAPQQPQPTSVAVQSQPREQLGNQISRAVTPSRSPSMIDFDTRINGMLNQLSPLQIQQLLSSLASQTITDTNCSSSVPTDTINPSSTSTLTQYQLPAFDFSQSTTNTSYSHPSIVSSDGLISFDQYDSQLGDANHSIVALGQQQHEQNMQRQWQGTDDIDKDVNAINTSISSFIQTFGLDSALLEGVDHTETSPTLGSSTNGNNPSVAPLNSDFDFDMFLNNLSGSNTGMDYGNIAASSGVGDVTGTAYLDEVHTPTASSVMTASPVQPLRHVSPQMTVSGDSTANDDSSTGASMTVINTGGSSVTAGSRGKSPGKKRKSDTVVDFDSRPEVTKATSGVKSRKRRDK